MMKDSVVTDRVIEVAFGALLLTAVFALGIVRVEDYDAWTHLALGRHIVQHRGFPATEAFNFPSLDMQYLNPEWLFDVVLYLLYLGAGIPGVILLKASLATLAFFILFKDSVIPQGPLSHRSLTVIMATAVLFAILLMVRYRFVERPDLALMVFLGFTIYALNAFVYEGKRYLYFLPPLQVLWVNMHPSILVGTVPFIAYLLGGWLQGMLNKRFGIEVPGTPSRAQRGTIAVVFAGVLVASLLNPYGIDPFVAPFRLATSLWATQEITELRPPGLGDTYGAPFIVTGLLGLVFMLTIRRISLFSVFLVVPFVYLGLSARRFIFLLAVVSGPVLARYLSSLVGRLRDDWTKRVSLSLGGLVILVIIAGTWLSIHQVAPFNDSFKISGFGINYRHIPEGALRYLDQADISGRLFNIFHWGGYIEWRDYPRRSPIIDGRGYVPPGLLDEIRAAQTSVSTLERLRGVYKFDVAILRYISGMGDFKGEVPDFDVALSSRDWALVYWDDLSLVYLRRTDSLKKIIEKDQYRYVKPANGLPYFERQLTNKDLIGPIEAELRRNVAETQSSIGYVLLGSLYNQIGNYTQAIDCFSRVRDFPFGSYLTIAYLGLGSAHKQLGDTNRAIDFYKKAARLKKNDPKILYLIGATFEELGNDREAIRYLERALEGDRFLVWVYPVLMRAYQRVGKTDRLPALEAGYRETFAHARAERHYRKAVKLYFEKHHQEAIVEFKKSLMINPRNAAALSNLGYVYFDLGRLDEAFTEQTQALEVDPNFANAHYGLALIYGTRGEPMKAREHFAAYLRLQPRGFWSRRAQEELSRIPGQ